MPTLYTECDGVAFVSPIVLPLLMIGSLGANDQLLVVVTDES